MKVEVDQSGNIFITEVYNSIILETADKEMMALCMRDSGFEFMYQGIWYEAKEGRVRALVSTVGVEYNSQVGE